MLPKMLRGRQNSSLCLGGAGSLLRVSDEPSCRPCPAFFWRLFPGVWLSAGTGPARSAPGGQRWLCGPLQDCCTGLPNVLPLARLRLVFLGEAWGAAWGYRGHRVSFSPSGALIPSSLMGSLLVLTYTILAWDEAVSKAPLSLPNTQCGWCSSHQICPPLSIHLETGGWPQAASIRFPTWMGPVVLWSP